MINLFPFHPRSILRLLVFHLFVLGAALLMGETPGQWPQFRGPNCSGVAPKAKPPVAIDPAAKVSWVIEVPWSPSSPVIWDDHLFLNTFDNGELETRCYHPGTGKLRWKKWVKPEELEVFHRTDGSPAASTPATDGTHVVSYFGSFGLICYQMDGEELWRHPLPVAKSGGSFGTGTSPVIAGDTVILQRDVQQGSALIALEVATGKVRWESPRPEATGSFGVPVIWDNKGVKEVVVAGTTQLKGYDLATGKQRWVVNRLSVFSCTTPAVGKDHLYYAAWCPGGNDQPWPKWEDFRGQHDRNKDGRIDLTEIDEGRRDFFRGIDADHDGALTPADWEILGRAAKSGKNKLVAVKAGGQGDITKTHVSWTYNKGLPYVPSPLLYDGRVYLVRNLGLVSSFDALTGEPHYSRAALKARGDYYASPVAADGRIYLTSLRGKLTVIKAGGESPEVLHEADFGERIFATPAIVGDKLYLRTATKLYAFGG
jgi:outer membrane protein assembly factor BamB